MVKTSKLTLGDGIMTSHGESKVFQQYFSYIVAVSFIGGGNPSIRRKQLTCRKSLTNFTT
jgi:hypothetical protein